MPTVKIHGPSPNDNISPLKQRSWDQDIGSAPGVATVASQLVNNNAGYSAQVIGGTTAAIRAALADNVPPNWFLDVQ